MEKRIIKFRGLRKNGTDRSGSKWLFGDFSHRDWLSIGCGNNGVQVYVFPFDDVISCEEDYEVIPETIGQFISLLDKSGKEIYEGDIIQYYSKELIVEINEVWIWGVRLKTINPPFRDSFLHDTRDILCDTDHIKVIGNIHDNSDLLTKK